MEEKVVNKSVLNDEELSKVIGGKDTVALAYGFGVIDKFLFGNRGKKHH
ncbi:MULTISPECIES: bacteriocin [Lactobacillus]|uniref:Bacteriocin n=1 Tax=Lactobacillus xujianguonis TaxID=2495899 RepID=A0A437STS4_9LACO|nr:MULTISPECIES: bacteriocin [Lactobacillus]RVU70346.1 bacteriocin [Lactobacillus xujianguonis]RVU76889.1 bacteriocin [Lactobacillus xujianguonis]